MVANVLVALRVWHQTLKSKDANIPSHDLFHSYLNGPQCRMWSAVTEIWLTVYDQANLALFMGHLNNYTSEQSMNYLQTDINASNYCE